MPKKSHAHAGDVMPYQQAWYEQRGVEKSCIAYLPSSMFTPTHYNREAPDPNFHCIRGGNGSAHGRHLRNSVRARKNTFQVGEQVVVNAAAGQQFPDRLLHNALWDVLQARSAHIILRQIAPKRLRRYRPRRTSCGRMHPLQLGDTPHDPRGLKALLGEGS
jgi:hypothetical protein